jgi:hypothetical protein
LSGNLTLDRLRHEYRQDGRLVPSVTQILKSVGLIDGRWFDEASASRGSVVHKCCELWDIGSLNESTVDPGALGYLDAWREFCEKMKFKPRTVEVPRYHPLGYAGTEDCENEEFDIDRKTGAVQKWTALQLVAYQHFHPRPHTRRRIAVQLKPDGRYAITEFGPSTAAADWAAFQSAL